MSNRSAQRRIVDKAYALYIEESKKGANLLIESPACRRAHERWIQEQNILDATYDE